MAAWEDDSEVVGNDVTKAAVGNPIMMRNLKRAERPKWEADAEEAQFPIKIGPEGMKQAMKETLADPKLGFKWYEKAGVGFKGDLLDKPAFLLKKAVGAAGPQDEADMEALRAVQEDPWGLAGGVAGSAALMGAAGLGANSALRLAAARGSPNAIRLLRLAESRTAPSVAVKSAISGAAESQLDVPNDMSRGEAAALGAGFGGAAGGIGLTMRRASRGLTPSEDARMLMGRGVTPSVGDIVGEGRVGNFIRKAEDRMTSWPYFGDVVVGARARGIADVNREAMQQVLDEARLPTRVRVQGQGREMLANVENQLHNRYEEVLGRVRPVPIDLNTPEGQRFMQNLNGIAADVGNFVDEQQQRRFVNFIQQRIIEPFNRNGTLDGEEMKRLISGLRNRAGELGKSQDVWTRDLGAGFDMARQSLADLLSSHMTRADGEALRNVDRAWAHFKRVQDAYTSLGAGVRPYGATPNEFMRAVRNADNSVDKGAFARGGALFQDFLEPAARVLGPGYPDSGTMGRGLWAMGWKDPRYMAAMLTAAPLYSRTGTRALFGETASQQALGRMLSNGGALGGAGADLGLRLIEENQ